MMINKYVSLNVKHIIFWKNEKDSHVRDSMRNILYSRRKEYVILQIIITRFLFMLKFIIIWRKV